MTTAAPPEHTLALARHREQEKGVPQYIVRIGEIYIIQERMPMIALEWWTPDGLRHG